MSKIKVSHEEFQTQLLIEIAASLKLLTELVVEEKFLSLRGDEQTEYHINVAKRFNSHYDQLRKSATSFSTLLSLNHTYEHEYELPPMKKPKEQ